MNQSPESFETSTLTKEQANMQIRELLQEAHAMGNNDHELPDFQVILDELAEDKINPIEAVGRAQGIRNSKLETSSM